MKDAGRYLFVEPCTSSTFEAVRAAIDDPAVTSVSLPTFRRAVGTEQFREFVGQLGYDRSFPISRDRHVGYYKGTYRGVRAYWLKWSGIEHFFTYDGQVRA